MVTEAPRLRCLDVLIVVIKCGIPRRVPHPCGKASPLLYIRFADILSDNPCLSSSVKYNAFIDRVVNARAQSSVRNFLITLMNFLTKRLGYLF